MRLVGDCILRIIIVLVAFILAAFAAGLFLSYGFSQQFLLSNTERQEMLPVTIPTGMFVFAFMLVWAAHIPAILMITVCELFRLRGLIVNLLLGALVAIVVAYQRFGVDVVINADGNIPDPRGSTGAMLVVLATGFIAAFVYWLVAGRNAGTWMDERHQRRAASRQADNSDTRSEQDADRKN